MHLAVGAETIKPWVGVIPPFTVPGFSTSFPGFFLIFFSQHLSTKSQKTTLPQPANPSTPNPPNTSTHNQHINPQRFLPLPQEGTFSSHGFACKSIRILSNKGPINLQTPLGMLIEPGGLGVSPFHLILVRFLKQKHPGWT